MIEEDYVSFDVVELLKEKGFEQNHDYATSWYANQYYKNSCQGEWFEGEHQIIEDIDDKCNISYLSECGIFIPAPTLQMAMKWLREERGVAVTPFISSILDNEKFLWDVEITVAKTNDTYHQGWIYEQYEEAVKAALKYCLKNLV